MKAVMLSVRPNWCEKITHMIGMGEDGKPIYEKSVEVRKTRPKIETPFPCFIYETQGKTETPWIDEDGHEIFKGKGQVIGEFVCDRIIDIPYSQYFVDYYHTMPQADLEATCLGMGHIDEYLLSKDGYGWHISDLVIYDTPKELSEFFKACDKPPLTDCSMCIDQRENVCKSLTRPPQSWCYVEVR